MKKTLFYFALLSAVACKKTETVETASALDSSAVATAPAVPQQQTAEIDSTPIDVPETQPITVVSMNYSFVLFDVVSRTNGNHRTVASDIEETPVGMSEDDEYRLLDKHLNDYKHSDIAIYHDVVSRELKTYTSYSEASKARERFLGRSGGSSNDAAQGAADAAKDAAADAKDAVKDAIYR